MSGWATVHCCDRCGLTPRGVTVDLLVISVAGGLGFGSGLLFAFCCCLQCLWCFLLSMPSAVAVGGTVV